MKIEGKELSEETIKKACEAYGINFEKKKKFKRVVLCHLRIDVDQSSIVLEWDASGSRECYQSPHQIRETIRHLQSAVDYFEPR